MAYQFRVNTVTCINCGICMDLCPVRCLDMTRPTGAGAPASADQRQSPIPGPNGERPWMMLTPVQVAACIGCEICAHECPTNAITIVGASMVWPMRNAANSPTCQRENGWQPLGLHTRLEEPRRDSMGRWTRVEGSRSTGALAGLAHLAG
jgi:ferredoxin